MKAVFHCNYCGAPAKFTIYQERYRWQGKSHTCGHRKFFGYTLPPAELERLGYINQDMGPDPRIAWAEKSKAQDLATAAAEQEAWEKKMISQAKCPRCCFTQCRCGEDFDNAPKASVSNFSPVDDGLTVQEKDERKEWEKKNEGFTRSRVY